MDVGKRIKAARQALGLSQSDLAGALSQHHVPIIARPLSAPDIDSGAVIGYMTASCEAARPFAFIAANDHPHLNFLKSRYARAALAISTASRASLVTAA